MPPVPLTLTTTAPNAFSLLTEAGDIPVVPMPALAPIATTLGPQPAALQGTQLVDPQNVTTLATSTGANTTTVNGQTGRVWSSWAALVAAWGTFTPYLNVSTAIVFVSSHVDNSDPVIFQPFIGKGATVSIQGTAPAVVAGGVVLAGTVAKSRAAGANSLLQENIGPNGTIAQLVRNTTAGKISRAWVYKNVAGNVFSMTQPLTPLAVGGSLVPSEVDTWANGDTADLLNPIAINLAVFVPTYLDGANTNAAKAYVYQCRAFDPGGVSTEALYVGEVRFYEVDIQRRLFGFALGLQGQVLVNCALRGILTVIGTYIQIGGAQYPTGGGDICDCFQSSLIDGDAILGGTLGASFQGAPLMALVFKDSNIVVQDGLMQLATSLYGSHVLYGSAGSLTVLLGSAKALLSGGSFTAGLTNPADITAVNLNGTTTATSQTLAQPAVFNANITTSVANLDAAAGATGFGGRAQRWGGCSISNE